MSPAMGKACWPSALKVTASGSGVGEAVAVAVLVAVAVGVWVVGGWRVGVELGEGGGLAAGVGVVELHPVDSNRYVKQVKRMSFLCIAAW